MGVVELAEDDAYFLSTNALTDTFFGVETGKLEGKSARQLNAPPEMLATWIERFRECRANGRPQQLPGAATRSPEPETHSF